MEKMKFKGFQIVEDGEVKELTIEDLIEYEKQGFEVEIRLVKPEEVKIIGMEFVMEDEKEKKDV